MNKDKILSLEKDNDGQTIYLFFDKMAGVYLAFGLSAYFTTFVTEPYLSYSEEMQMPVALLRRAHILYLRQSIIKEEHVIKSFYRFKMKSMIGNVGYQKWSDNIYSNFFR